MQVPRHWQPDDWAVVQPAACCFEDGSLAVPADETAPFNLPSYLPKQPLSEVRATPSAAPGCAAALAGTTYLVTAAPFQWGNYGHMLDGAYSYGLYSDGRGAVPLGQLWPHARR